jgi:DNA polymerase-3 subunit epsilon
MYLPDFLDGFDRLVAFAETTGKGTPDADFVRRQPFAWRAPGIIIEVGFVEMLRDGEACAKARRGAPGLTRMGQSTPRPSRSTGFGPRSSRTLHGSRRSCRE